MKRFSPIVSILWVSGCMAMVQNNLQTNLETLGVRLHELEQAVVIRALPVPPMPPVIITPPVVTVPPVPVPPVLPKPPKIKDPLKQIIAQYLGGLSVEQRADFEKLTPEERNSRLAQLFGGGVKQQEPVAPSSLDPDEPSTPEIPLPPVPPAPGGLIPAPPAPPAPGLPPLGKPKPAAPVVPLLPLLSEQELASLTSEQKNASDAAFITMFKDLAQTEYSDNKLFASAVRKSLRTLRNQKEFVRRAQLDAVLDEKSGFIALLAKDFNAAGGHVRLMELYESFTKVRPEVLLQGIIQQFAYCLFENKQLSIADVELLIVSSISSTRKAAQKTDESISQAVQDASDTVFLQTWQALSMQDAAAFVEDNALNRLARAVNFLRIHPSFVLFEDMLWKGAAGSQQRQVQVAKKISPLLLFLQAPRQFVTKVDTGAIDLKRNAGRHVFDLTTYEKSISTESVKKALAWQLSSTKVLNTQTLEQYVTSRLKNISSLTQLQTLLKSVLQEYEGRLGNSQGVIAALQAELVKPAIDTNLMVEGFKKLAGQLPEDVIDQLTNVVQSDSRDKQIVAIVQAALKNKAQFTNQLIAGFGQLPELQKQLDTVVHSLYRTPRDVYNVIYKAVKNKKLLADNRITVELFYELIKPYGILLRVFDYFARRYDVVNADKEKVKLNLAMLQESLQVLNNAKKYFDPKTADYKKLKGLKTTASSSIEGKRPLVDMAVAPILLDIETNDQLLGAANAGYYTDQLSSVRTISLGGNSIEKMGIYEKLDALIAALNNKDAHAVVVYLTNFVENAQGVDVTSQGFVELMQRVQTALAGSFA